MVTADPFAASVTVTVRGKTYPVRDRLKADGFRWSPHNRWWTTVVGKPEVPALLTRYGRMGLSVSTDEPEYNRSSGYRRMFLQTHEGPAFRCVYCGRKLRVDSRGPDRLTVDHVIPVQAVNGSPASARNRKLLEREGLQDINDPKNLVPACPACNRKKSDRNSVLWRFRARTGRWVFRSSGTHFLQILRHSCNDG